MNTFKAYLESLDQNPTVQAATDLYVSKEPSPRPDNAQPVHPEEIPQEQPDAPYTGPRTLNDEEIKNLCSELESIWKRTHQFAPVIRAVKESGILYLGSGTSRMVFKLNDEKVLKLAKNAKGLDQNNAEADWYLRQVVGIAEWYSASNEDIWIVSELCTKAKTSDFRKKLGITFADYCNYVNYLSQEHSGHPNRYMHFDQPAKFEEYVEAENLLGGINEYIGNWDPPVGDLTRISSYGINRDGDIVLVDTGLSENVAEKHYTHRR